MEPPSSPFSSLHTDYSKSDSLSEQALLLKAFHTKAKKRLGQLSGKPIRENKKPLYILQVPKIPQNSDQCFLFRSIPTRKVSKNSGYVSVDLQWQEDNQDCSSPHNCGFDTNYSIQRNSSGNSPSDLLPPDWEYVLHCPDDEVKNVTALYPAANRSVPITKIRIENGFLAKDSYFQIHCSEQEKRNGCLEPCPYPYFRDLFDGGCKIADLRAMEPVRPYGGPCDFHHTCFTREANDPESTWPWESMKEKYDYYESNVTGANKVGPALKCKRERRQQRLGFNFENSNACAVLRGDGNLTLGCGDQWAFQHHLVFMPKAKLIFCGIPKNGITEWLKFFRFMIGAKDYLAYPHFKKDLYEFHLMRLPASKAAQLLSDPTWTKAVIFRNPVDRLLSAFLNKILKQKDGFQDYNTTDFSELIDKLSTNNSDCRNPGLGVHRCTDPHFAAQVHACALDSHLPIYDFIGSLDYAAKHTRLLLEKTGSWERFGSRYESRALIKALPFAYPVPIDNDTVGFNQESLLLDVDQHSENAKEKISEYYTKGLLKKLREAYAMDYEIWDALESKKGRPLTARDLDVVRKACK